MVYNKKSKTIIWALLFFFFSFFFLFLFYRSFTDIKWRNQAFKAVLMGDLKALKEAGDLRENMDGRYWDGNNLIHVSIEKNNCNLIPYLIEKGVDINVHDKNGSTSVELAAQHDSSQCLEIVLKHQADPFLNNKMKIGCGPLHYSIMANKVASFGVLIKIKNLANHVCDNGFSPLHWAAIYQRVEFSKLLIQYGANTKTKDPLHHKTPCDYAMTKRNMHLEKVLCEKRE